MADKNKAEKVLNRDDILKMGNDIKIKKVKVAKDCYVYIKEFTAAERDAFEASTTEKNGVARTFENVRAKLLVRGICDEKGNLLFKNADIEALGKMPAKKATLLFQEILSLNAITDDDIAELEKN